MSGSMNASGLTKALLTLLCVLMFSEPAPAQILNSRSPLPSRRKLDRYGLKLAWWSQAVIDPRKDKVRHVTTDEELTYVQSSSGMVTAFDNTTGKRVWFARFGYPDQWSFPLITNDNVALITSGLKLFAVNKHTGRLRWQIRMPHQPSTSPSMDDKRVYIGTLNGTLIAFELEKIRELYEKNLLPQWTNWALAWRYKAGKEITTPAVPIGSEVCFASRDGSLYVIDVATRDLKFQLETDSPVAAPLAFSDGLLYLASQDFKFYCINTLKPGNLGSIEWEFAAELPIRKSPRIIGHQVFLTLNNGGIYCLSKATGKQFWWQPKATRFLAATSKLVYTSDNRGNVLVLSRDDGAVLGPLMLSNFSARIENDRTDRLFLTTATGRIVCIHEKSQDSPIFFKYPDRKPILPAFAPEENKKNDKPPLPDTADDDGA